MRLLLCTAMLVSCGSLAASYPKVEIHNQHLKVEIFLPDAEKGYYRGTRFDWSGIIKQVTYNNHIFYAPLHETHHPMVHDSVSGPAEEFGMYHPLGYSEAKPGEEFIKIGVGVLRKAKEEPYQFHQAYELIRPGDWQISYGSSWIEFRQLLQEKSWGYRYSKRIELDAQRPEFTIFHRLENSGTQTIKTDHYNHNFTHIDKTPYGPDYRVTLPFSSPAPQQINQLAQYVGNQIRLDQALGERALWHEISDSPASSDHYQGMIQNAKTGAWLSFQGDHPISRYVFWAVERSVSLEPFIQLQLVPGEIAVWSIRYRFGTSLSPQTKSY